MTVAKRELKRRVNDLEHVGQIDSAMAIVFDEYIDEAESYDDLDAIRDEVAYEETQFINHGLEV